MTVKLGARIGTRRKVSATADFSTAAVVGLVTSSEA